MRIRHFQIVADENFPRDAVLLIQKWTTVGQIGHELGRKGMADQEIIPKLLLRVRRSTLLTQDQAIYAEHAPHRSFCLLVMPRNTTPAQLHDLARTVLRTSGFTTVAQRVGKVARVSGGRVIWREAERPGEFSRALAMS